MGVGFFVFVIVAIWYFKGFFFFFSSHAGVSRSVTVITAFMMKTDQLTFEKAYENLKTVKPEAKWVICCSSNSAFVMQFYLFKENLTLYLFALAGWMRGLSGNWNYTRQWAVK